MGAGKLCQAGISLSSSAHISLRTAYGDGSAIGHFGYDLKCPDDVGTTEEVYIDINENNLFSPDPKDRGQPKIFLTGKHIDEFEVEFSRSEVKGGSVIHWSVQGQTAEVDFSKTKDVSLTCSVLPK